MDKSNVSAKEDALSRFERVKSLIEECQKHEGIAYLQKRKCLLVRGGGGAVVGLCVIYYCLSSL